MHRVRVVHREAVAHQAVDVVDLRALDVGGAEVVHQDLDDFSAPYIQGSEIDYIDSLMGAGFTVHNPNAVHSCSCGSSFDTGDDAGEAKACGCGH